MAEFLSYLLESSLCLAGMVVLYQLFLRRLGHFGMSRAYLLLVAAASLLIPALHWEVSPDILPMAVRKAPAPPVQVRTVMPWREVEEPVVAKLVPAPELPAPQPAMEAPVTAIAPPAGPEWSMDLWSLLFLAWCLGASAALVRLALRMAKLMKYRRLPADAGVVALPGGGGSFSFAGRIFLDDAGLSPFEKEMVIHHERTHLRLGHFWDNLFLELSTIVWWFHPLLPVLRRNLREIHEYQADSAASAVDPLSYSRLVLKLASSRSHQWPAIAFSSSKAGRRIEMLHRKPESKMSKLKYLLLLPLLSLLGYAFILVPAPSSLAATTSPHGDARLEFAGEKVPVEIPHVHSYLESELKRLRADAALADKLKERAKTLAPRVTSIMTEEGVPLDFFYIAVAESNLRLDANSPGGACGMWQFMPGTARTFGLVVNGNTDQRMDPVLATRAACKYLRSAHGELGSWVAAAVAFNRGVPGYRNFLANRKAESYFDVKDQRERYLYRVLAYKLLMLQRPVPSLGASDADPVNPPHAWPLEKGVEVEISSPFGNRYDQLDRVFKLHGGIDLKAPEGTAVLAPADGEVLEVGEDDAHGKYIKIQHDPEYVTRYFHLSETSVTVGKSVKAGMEIGKVGSTGRSTGPHLHYEVLKEGKPVDPALYFSDPHGALPGNIERFRGEYKVDYLNGMKVERNPMESRNRVMSGGGC